MPRHDADVRLRHMLDAAREGVQMAQGKTRADLDADRPLNFSLVRLLEIVGRRPRAGLPFIPCIDRRERMMKTKSSVASDPGVHRGGHAGGCAGFRAADHRRAGFARRHHNH